MRRDSTVAVLLTRVFGVLVVLILLSGSAGVAAAVLQHRSVQQLTEHVLPLRLANAQLRSVLGDAQRGLRGYLLTGDQQFLAAFDSADAAYPGVQGTVRRLAQGSEQTAIDEQARQAENWWALARQQRGAAPRSAEAARFVEQGKIRFDRFLTANAELDSSLARSAEQLARDSRTLRAGTTIALVALTVLAGLSAAVTARRTTRRITRPLTELGAVLDRLGAGDRDARVAISDEPLEIRRVARSVNRMAEEAERTRLEQEQSAGLRSSARALGVRIRQYLAVQSALLEAVRGLGEMVRADAVVGRLAGGEPKDPTVVCWSGAEIQERSLTDVAELDLGWLAEGGIWSTADVRRAGDDVPAAERRALVAAGAGPVLTVAVGAAGDQFGGVTMIRRQGAHPWAPEEVRIVESVAADLGRGVRQAQMYEQEQQLVLRLQELDTAKTDFMSTVSHELRTPLTSIAGYVEMLQDEDAGPVNTDQAKMLDVIDRNTRRLRALIGDLLILSKIEAGTFKTQRRTVELAGLIATVCEAIKPVSVRAGVSMQVHVDGPLELPADPDQLERVLTNLVSNAVKFTASGGTVEIRAHRDGGEVVLAVADSGMGIPEPEQGQLFSRFFRASNAVRLAVPGTGLGLAIVHTVVQNHGGRITVSSREGVGTTFTVRLPGR